MICTIAKVKDRLIEVNAVKAFIEREDGKVLFLEETKPSGKTFYGLPGGRLENNETEEEGLKRELLEETGLELKGEIEFAGGYSFVMENGTTQVNCKVFKCAVENHEVKLAHGAIPQERLVAFHWISPSEFLSKKMPSVGESFNAFLEECVR